MKRSFVNKPAITLAVLSVLGLAACSLAGVDDVADKGAGSDDQIVVESTNTITSETSETTAETTPAVTPTVTPTPTPAPLLTGPDYSLILDQLLADYVYSQQYIDGMIDDLNNSDPAVAKQWLHILNIWDEVNTDLTINDSILPDDLPDTDELCLVVLGYQLNDDGTMKEELEDRLAVALQNALNYPNALIVCTGGGTASDNEDATEAGVMAQWLTDNGISEDRIIIEDRSQSTAENAIFTYRILKNDYPQVNSIAIITSDYHVATGVLLFDSISVLLEDESVSVVSNAACAVPDKELTTYFQALQLMELYQGLRA